MTSDRFTTWASRMRGRQAAVAVALSLGAIGVRAAIDPWMGDRHEFLSAYAAVALATWLATWRAGAIAAVLAIGAMTWLFDVPRNNAELLSEWHGRFAFATAAAVSGLIILLQHRSTTFRNALLQKVVRLDAADHRKSDFLAFVAHELRNPLSTLLVGTGLIKKGALDPTLSHTLQMVERQTAVMQRLVNDLLDVSKIEQGKIALSRTKSAISEVIECAITDVLSLTNAGSARIVYLPRDQGAALIDRLRIGQVVGNLLHNAVKFSPHDGVVTVTSESSGGDVSISVKDDGIGIPADELHTIFQSFVQLDAPSAHPPGLGLGLSLSRKLVEMHGGVLQVKSDGPGRGAEFTVRLPRGLPHDLGEPARRQSKVLDEYKETPAIASERRLLVVDDNRDAAESLALLLTLKGYTTSIAGDGKSAIEAAVACPPDMIFLDIGLPDISGHEVALRLRQEIPGCKQPVLVALTGWGSAEDLRRSKQTGFDAHLTKPVTLEQLDEALEIHRTVC